MRNLTVITTFCLLSFGLQFQAQTASAQVSNLGGKLFSKTTRPAPQPEPTSQPEVQDVEELEELDLPFELNPFLPNPVDLDTPPSPDPSRPETMPLSPEELEEVEELLAEEPVIPEPQVETSASPPDLDLDMTNPELVAAACLKAYQQQDMELLAMLSTPVNQDIFRELQVQGENHPRYQSIFNSERFKAVSAWNSTEPLATRFENNQTAVVEFGATREESFVVKLLLQQNRWLFEDVNSLDRSEFRELSKTQNAEPAN